VQISVGVEKIFVDDRSLREYSEIACEANISWQAHWAARSTLAAFIFVGILEKYPDFFIGFMYNTQAFI
jgi:hypothetical protein